MTESNAPVLLHREGGIAEIVLNRPEVLNAISTDMANAFLKVSRAIAEDNSIRVVLVRGAGRAFMAGGDLGEFHADLAQGPEVADRIIRPMNEAVRILAALPIPVVASLHGAVAGAGFSLALACDLALAADNVKFTMAYSKIGASLDVSASWSLPRVVGLRKAMEISLLGDIFDGEEAKRLGIVNFLVPADKLADETTALVQRLAKGPTASYGAIKGLLRASDMRTLAEQLEAERLAFRGCTVTQDFAEGVGAFIEKRKPSFVGR